MRARHDRLTFGSRQGRADQRPANRAFFVVTVGRLAATLLGIPAPVLRDVMRGRRPDRAWRWIDVMPLPGSSNAAADAKTSGSSGATGSVIGIGVGELSDRGRPAEGPCKPSSTWVKSAAWVAFAALVPEFSVFVTRALRRRRRSGFV